MSMSLSALQSPKPLWNDGAMDEGGRYANFADSPKNWLAYQRSFSDR